MAIGKTAKWYLPPVKRREVLQKLWNLFCDALYYSGFISLLKITCQTCRAQPHAASKGYSKESKS